MKIITSLLVVLLLTQTYALQLTHEQTAPAAASTTPAPAPAATTTTTTPAASTTTTGSPTVAQVAPNPAATGAATATASTEPTENDLSAAEKEIFTKWKSNLIPWAKVQGKDVSATFND